MFISTTVFIFCIPRRNLGKPKELMEGIQIPSNLLCNNFPWRFGEELLKFRPHAGIENLSCVEKTSIEFLVFQMQYMPILFPSLSKGAIP